MNSLTAVGWVENSVVDPLSLPVRTQLGQLTILRLKDKMAQFHVQRTKSLANGDGRGMISAWKVKERWERRKSAFEFGE